MANTMQVGKRQNNKTISDLETGIEEKIATNEALSAEIKKVTKVKDKKRSNNKLNWKQKTKNWIMLWMHKTGRRKNKKKKSPTCNKNRKR